MTPAPSHALVRFIRRNRWVPVKVHDIWEFEPQHELDFEEKKLYAAKFSEEGSKYEAAEINCLGSEEVVCMAQEEESRPRLKSNKFNESDIDENTFDLKDKSTSIESSPSSSLNSFEVRRKVLLGGLSQPITSNEMMMAELMTTIKKQNERIKQLEAVQTQTQDRSNGSMLQATSTPLKSQSENPKAKRQLFIAEESHVKKSKRAKKNTDEFFFPAKDFNYEQESRKVSPLPCMKSYTTKNGTERFHLAYGYDINEGSWGHIKRGLKKKSNLRLTTKLLIRLLYEEGQLANRCIVYKHGGQTKKYTDRESPRKVVTPKKMYTVRVALKHLLTKEKTGLVDKYELDGELDLIKNYVSREINYQIAVVKEFQEQLKKTQSADLLSDGSNLGESTILGGSSDTM